MIKIPKNLNEKIDLWVAKGFISSEQKDKILAHETQKSDTNIQWLLLLASFLIGMGTIAIIAFNWRNISDTVKLVSNFSLLTLIAGLTYYFWQKGKDRLFETFLFLMVIHCMASIGLISQVYHLSSLHVYPILMTWCLITFVLMMHSKAYLVPFMWFVAFGIGFTDAAKSYSLFVPIFQKNNTAITMVLPLFLGCLVAAFRKYYHHSPQEKSLKLFLYLSGLASIFIVDSSYLLAKNYSLTTFYPSYVLSALLLIFIVRESRWNLLQKVLLSLFLMLYLVSFHLNAFAVKSGVWYAMLTILMLSCFALYTASVKNSRFFKFLLSLIALRFTTLYYQEFGGLHNTGVALVLSGLFLFFLIAFWNKYHKKIELWAERLGK